MTTHHSPSKRTLLSAGAALSAATFLGMPGRAIASLEDIEKAISDFGGGASAKTGKITLKMPEIAENGNSVPISVSVESAMTEDDYVESVMILARANPHPEVITFRFTPASGRANVSTRMRLAQTQNVVAYAKLSGGALLTDTLNVKVTVGGCGG